MGRHNKSNGHATDPTYNYDRFAPAHQGPRPCYGRATQNGRMTRMMFLSLVKNDPSHFPCGVVRPRLIAEMQWEASGEVRPTGNMVEVFS